MEESINKKNSSDNKEGYWDYVFEVVAKTGEDDEEYMTIRAVGNYIDGKRDGNFCFTFFESGDLYAKGKYILGQQVGLWHFFHINKEPRAITMFEEKRDEIQWVRKYNFIGELTSEKTFIR